MVEVQYDKEKFNEVVPRICEFLIRKTSANARRHDQNNKTLIDDVWFWFDVKYDELGHVIPGQPIVLSFSASPDLWDFQKIKWDIDLKERQMLISAGIAIRV